MKNFFYSLKNTYIIAEIGVNHNGDINLAKKMIISAIDSGANAVKFQTFSAKKLVSKGTPKVSYQMHPNLPDESHYEMLTKLSLSEADHLELFNFCNNNSIDFISTPYDIESAEFLLKLGVKVFKTASADIVDFSLHNFLAKTKLPVIIATGMASEIEIKDVIQIYYGHKNNNIALLQCVSNYPCSDKSLNLNVMKTFASNFNCVTGFSDHSNGYLAAALSISLGGKVIEKHFTLDKELDGPDHKASSTPDEFKELVFNIRRAEVILGSACKKIQPEEAEMAKISRKSIFISKNKKTGEELMLSDLCFMRPGIGILANQVNKIIGKRLIKDIKSGTMLSWNDLKE